MLQGVKRTVFGEVPFDYAAGQALIVTTAMPGVSRILKADALRPYLGVIIEFDIAVLRDIFMQLSHRLPQQNTAQHEAFVIDIDAQLSRC